MIVGKKIILRTYRESDVLPILELKNKAACQMPYNGQPFGTQSQYLAQYRKTGFWGPEEGGGRMLICGPDDACFGEIRFGETSSHIQTISYMLFKKSDYGKGYITEALGLFRDYLFSTFPALNRLQLYIHIENIGSIRVAEKCSFVREGIARATLFIEGRYCDQFLYSMLRAEWKSS